MNAGLWLDRGRKKSHFKLVLLGLYGVANYFWPNSWEIWKQNNSYYLNEHNVTAVHRYRHSLHIKCRLYRNYDHSHTSRFGSGKYDICFWLCKCRVNKITSTFLSRILKNNVWQIFLTRAIRSLNRVISLRCLIWYYNLKLDKWKETSRT